MVPELTEHELETAKMYQDTFKHLTTFSSGAILLSSSVVAAFFVKPDLWALYLSLAFFLIAVALATLGLRITVRHLDEDFRAGASDADADRRHRLMSNFCTGAVVAAYTGVVWFAVFAAYNFVI